MSTVELREIHKSYGAAHVVKGLNLTVAKGELLSLLGPSGCGKTTTLRIIAGLERLDKGNVLLAGETVDDTSTYVPPEKRALGMVFQSYAIWPNKSVEENVAYPLQLRKVGRADVAKRVKEALQWVRLEQLATRRPHQLSGGQLQRVALARALAADPKVLLLDEPLSNLDAALREELAAEIAALRARLGTTMVYVTHDQHEALSLSTRIAVMNQGVLQQVDTPKAIYEQPRTAFVAGFVGKSNVLVGKKVDGYFETENIRFALPPELEIPGGIVHLAVRAEDFSFDSGGTPLPLAARLYLGHTAEYRFQFGNQLLRMTAPLIEATPGQTLHIRINKARAFGNDDVIARTR